jgi:hypothetical protein
MTPEERKVRDINAIRAAFVGTDIALAAEALVQCYDADALVRLIVKMKRRLRAPVEPYTEEVPGHGVWKPREHDPNPEVARLESNLPEGDEKYVAHEYGG